jgi:glycosyltransferase involved in cell wall biosynthesis
MPSVCERVFEAEDGTLSRIKDISHLKPLHVLHINAGNLYGGVENTLLIFARQHQWDSRLRRSIALCFEGTLSKILAADGTPAVLLGRVRLRYPWQVFKVRRKLRRLLGAVEFDAVVCHMPWALLIFGRTVRRAGVPLIFWMHGLATGKSIVERGVRRLRPDLAIVNSQFTAQTLPKLFATPPRHVIIHPPASLHENEMTAEERIALRHQLGASDSDTVIIQVSRMDEFKGHHLHLQALALLPRDLAWRCWMVGGAQRPVEQHYLAKLKQRSKELGLETHIQWLGERRDVARLLAASDIFCQPNLAAEPFGVVFIEAFLSTLPVITTAIGGAVEIVDQTCGRTVPPNDPVALAASLQELIVNSELRRELGGHGPERACALSDPDMVLTQFEAVVRQLLPLREAAPSFNASVT